MTFLDHLEALRWHLIRSASAVLIFAIVAYAFSGILFRYVLLAPKYSDFPTYRFFCWLSHTLFGDESLCMQVIDMTLINISMGGQFTADLTVSIVAGIVIAFPYLLWELWRFIRPALFDKERKYANGLIFWGSFLFFSGISFGYFVITPLSVYFFGNYKVNELVSNQISLDSFISLVSSTTIGAGIVFELPIVIYFLSKIGLVGPTFLKRTRKISYVVILILAAIITPPDVTSQIIVSIPLFLLYEVSIWISARVEKEKA